MKVGLFIPCYVNQFYPEVAIATLQLLEKCGCEVDYPADQTCCGQPLANSGYQHLTEGVCSRFQDVFQSYDHVVCPSGSCTLHAKDHIKGDFRVYELVEYLHDVLDYQDFSNISFPHKVGMHSSCHGLRGLRLAKSQELMEPPFDKAKALLSSITDIELVDLAYPNECCGFGGTFAVSEEALSVQMGKDRLTDHTQAGAEVICGGDMSCLMHLSGISSRQKEGKKFMHIAQILNGDQP